VRDVLADNSPALPTDYAYGSDGSAVSVVDSSLGNTLITVSLTDILTQNADTTTGWESITNSSATEPIQAANGRLELLQSAFVGEAEANAQDTVSDSSYSDGAAAEITQGVGSSFDFTFTNEYDVPQSNAAIYFRGDRGADDTANAVDISLDGQLIGFGDELPIPGVTEPEWSEFNVDTDIPAGTHTVTVEYSGFEGNTNQRFDLIAVVDKRYVKDVANLDNTLSSSSGYLSDPSLFPSGFTQTLNSVTTRRNISEGTFNSTWVGENVTGAQAIELSRDGSTFQTFNNTTSASYTFSSPTQEITARFVFDNYGSRTGVTPTEGFEGQAVDLWELFVNPGTPSPDDIGTTNARAIVPPNTSGITGNTVREAGLKSGSTLLTHHQLAEFVLETDQRLASSETNRFKGTE
jgi:hypothetical protein